MARDKKNGSGRSPDGKARRNEKSDGGAAAAKGKAKRAAVNGASKSLACVILAAGKGTRMRSGRSKVLHELLGRPLVAYPVELAQGLGANPVVVVLGHQRPAVETVLRDRFGDGDVRTVEQTEQLGTGHALRMALPALRGEDGVLLVLYGDVPLVRRETLSALVGSARRYGCLALVTAAPPDASGYGRIVRDGRGHVIRIVEHRDATPEEQAIGEVNAGIYAGPVSFFREAVLGLESANAQKQYYLTDLVARAAQSIGVTTVEADHRDVAGVNDRRQLAEAEASMRARVNGRWLEHVTFRDPASTVVEPDVTLAVDVELGRGVALRGRTRIGRGARIGDGAILSDTVVGAGAEILPYTVATQAEVGAGCRIGPFAHLRPGTVLGPEVHLGNFVETKKTKLGRGSKVNHLSYLGDTQIGERVNVGAGTITCNDNGYEKQTTIIDDGAFIGSDTQLVAPVKVGRRAVVAAGTTVTEDVPPGALAIARVPQKNVAGYAQKVAKRYAERSGHGHRGAGNGDGGSAGAAVAAGRGGRAST